MLTFDGIKIEKISGFLIFAFYFIVLNSKQKLIGCSLFLFCFLKGETIGATDRFLLKLI